MRLSEIALRNVFRNKRRSFLSSAAIAVAALCIVLLFSFLQGMKTDMKNNLKNFVTGDIRIRNVNFEKYSYLNPLQLNISNYKNILELISNFENVESLVPRITNPTNLLKADSDTRYKAISVGVDFEKEKRFMDMDGYLIEGRFPEKGKNEAVIGKMFAEKIELGIGDEITLFGRKMRKGTNAMTFTITGIMDFPFEIASSSYIMTYIDKMQHFLKMNKSIIEILVKLKKGKSLDKTAININEKLKEKGRNELVSYSWEKIDTSYSLVELMDISYNFVALFFFVLGSSVIINTTMMVVYERIREIGTISAMGMFPGEIVKLFFLEAMYLGIIGAFSGVLIGIILAVPGVINGFNYPESFKGMGLELSRKIYLVLDFKTTIFVFLYIVVISSFTSIIPSSKAARVNPIEALRVI